MARKSLSDKGVAALKPRAKRYAEPDPQVSGHYVRVQPSGAKSYCAVARTPDGKQVWTTIGPTDVMAIDDAREQAREIIKRVRAGLPAVATKGETFDAVAANWIKRHVEPNRLRSKSEILRLLDKHILPAWAGREFTSIRRSEVTALLDRVEDHHGARQADYCLNVARSIMNWYAARNDDYTPPIIRGMARQSRHAQARARILDDAEIALIWRAAESCGTFGAFVRLCLLTGQRSRKVARMRWDELADGAWHIPLEPREKGNGGQLVLPAIALNIVEGQPRLGDNPFVLAGRRGGHLAGFGSSKPRLDAMLPKGTPPWVLHDLRRTARSLMSRASVRPDIAERVMGHSIAGVEGVYDRHSYRDEKADALKRLAALIDSIAHPKNNVLPLASTTKR